MRYRVIRPKKRIAPAVKGGRIPKYSGLHPKAAQFVDKLAAKFNCSKSFVIAFIVAEFAEIHEEGDFHAS